MMLTTLTKGDAMTKIEYEERSQAIQFSIDQLTALLSSDESSAIERQYYAETRQRLNTIILCLIEKIH